MQLYSFNHSSASYRVRIALAIKGLDFDIINVDLLNSEHLGEEYRTINPQGRVPFLIDGAAKLSQSLAIIEYLEEKYPNPPLLPHDAIMRAHARAFANVIAADIFPLQNLSTRKKIRADFSLDEIQEAQWAAFWIARGFRGLETQLANQTPQSKFLFADYPTIADICLVPQMNNARRYKVELSEFPILCEFDKRAREHEAFIKYAPK